MYSIRSMTVITLHIDFTYMLIYDVIKQKESEVDYDMLLVSGYFILPKYVNRFRNQTCTPLTPTTHNINTTSANETGA